MSDQVEQRGSEVHALAEISNRVRARFPDAPAEQVEREVDAAFHQFDGQPIRDFIPILVERAVIERLGARRPSSVISRANLPAQLRRQ